MKLTKPSNWVNPTVFSIMASLCFSTSANAQSETAFIEAFSGTWKTWDNKFAKDDLCQLELTTEKTGDQNVVKMQNCSDELAGSQSWGIVDGQLGIFGENLKVIARLGGNQRRMSGALETGSAIVFERIDPGASSQEATTDPMLNGLCLFYGYTATCASEADRLSPVADKQKNATANVLVKLNARVEPRLDAEIVSVVPQNSCLAVDQCTTASDGNWCKAKLADSEVWISQRAVRLERWPILTFKSGC